MADHSNTGMGRHLYELPTAPKSQTRRDQAGRAQDDQAVEGFMRMLPAPDLGEQSNRRDQGQVKGTIIWKCCECNGEQKIERATCWLCWPEHEKCEKCKIWVDGKLHEDDGTAEKINAAVEKDEGVWEGWEVWEDTSEVIFAEEQKGRDEDKANAKPKVDNGFIPAPGMWF